METRRTSVSDTLYIRDRDNIQGYEVEPASDEDEDEDDEDDEGRLQIDLGEVDDERPEPNLPNSISHSDNVTGTSSKIAGKNSVSKINPLTRLQQLVQAPFFAPPITTANRKALQGCDTYTASCGSSTTLTVANKQLSARSSDANNGELGGYPYSPSLCSSNQHQQQLQQSHIAYNRTSLPMLTPRPGSANQIDQNGTQCTSYVGSSSTGTTTITPINNANAAINYSRMQRVRNKLKEAAIDELNIRHLQKLADDEAQSFYKFRETVLQSSLASYPVDGLRKVLKSPLKLHQPDLVTVTAIGDDLKSPIRRPPSAIELATGVRTPPTLTVISYRGHTQQSGSNVATISLPPPRAKINNRRSPPPMVPIESLANFRIPPSFSREDGVCKTIEDNVMTRLKRLGTDIELEKTPATIPSLPSSVTCTPTLPGYEEYSYSAGLYENEEEEDDDDLPSFPFAVDCVLSTESSPPSPPYMPVVTKTNNGGYMPSLKLIPEELSNNVMTGRVQPPPPSLIPIGCSSVQQSQQTQFQQQQIMARLTSTYSLSRANESENWMSSVVAMTGDVASSSETAATTTTTVPAATKKKKKTAVAGGGIQKKPKTNKSDIAKLAHALVMQPGMTVPPTIVIATNDENDEIKTTTVMVKPQSSPFLASDDGKQPFSNEVEIIKIEDRPLTETPITVALTQSVPPSSATTACASVTQSENQLLSVTATAPTRKILHGASAALDQTMVCSQVVGSGRKLYSCSICSSVYHKPYNVRKHVYRQHLNLRYIVEKEAKKYEIGWPLETAGLGPISYEAGLFRCDTCYRIFDERDTLKLHLLEHPPREDIMSKSRVGRFPCPGCALKFSKKKVYLRHLKECQEYVANQNAHDIKPSTSPLSMLTVASSPPLPSPPPLVPAVVMQEESKQPESVIPVLVPPPPPPPPLSPSPPASTIAVEEEPPAEHEERKDEEEDVEETVNRLCLFCDLEFTNNAARQRHVLQQHHPKRKRQSCAYCKRRGFTDLRDLLRHIVSSHSDIYFGCVSCKVRFKTNDELTAHDIESHQSEESSPKKAEGEKKIEKTDSTDTTRPSIVANATVKNGKTFKCSSCSTVFHSMMELSRHRKAEHRASKGAIRNASNTNDYSYETKYRNTVITCTDYETEFYRNLSNNVRLNLEVHMEGKIVDSRRPTEKAMTRSCLANLNGDKERGDGQRDRENDTELSFQDMYGAENISGRFIRNVSRLHLETQLTMLKKANLLNKNVGGDVGLPNVRNACIARELSLTPQKMESGTGIDQPYEEETSLCGLTCADVGVMFSGEWIKEKKYVCAACLQSFNGFWEWDDHRWLKHPNVWNTYYVFPSEDAPGRQWAMKLSLKSVGVFGKCNDGKLMVTHATNTPSSVCTKCQKMITPLSEFHKHILECGGDVNWMATIYTPTKRHRKWKPYCGHRRKKTVPKRRMFLRNIPETPMKLPNLSRNKQKAGDSETIQRMIANLPPKRITRRVVSFDDIDSKSRNRGRARGCVLTRQRRERLDPKTSAQIAKTFAVDSYETSQAAAILKRNKQTKRETKPEEEASPRQPSPASSISGKLAASPKLEIKIEAAAVENISGNATNSSSNSSAEDACQENVANTSSEDSPLELPKPPPLMPAPSLDAAVNEDEERSFELMTIDAATEESAPSLPDSEVILAAMRETMRQTDVAIPNQVFMERKRKRGESKKDGGTIKITGKSNRSSASAAVEASSHSVCRVCGTVVFGSSQGPEEICSRCCSKKQSRCIDCGTTIIDVVENDDDQSKICEICTANRRKTDEIVRTAVTEMVAVVCETYPAQVTQSDATAVNGSALHEESIDIVSQYKAESDCGEQTVMTILAFESTKKALFQDESEEIPKTNSTTKSQETWPEKTDKALLEMNIGVVLPETDMEAASIKNNTNAVLSEVNVDAFVPTSSISKTYEQLKTMEIYDNVQTTNTRQRRQSTVLERPLSSEEPNTRLKRRKSTNGEHLLEELNTQERRKSSDIKTHVEETPAKELKESYSATKLKPSETLDKGKNNITNVSNVILQCKGCHGQFVTVSSYKEHSEKCPYHNANQETDKKPLLGFAKRNQKKKADDSTSCESSSGVTGGPSFEILETVPSKSLDGSLSSDGRKSPVDLSAQSENLVPPVLFDGDTMCGPLRRTAYRKATHQSIQETIDSVIEKFCKSLAGNDKIEGGGEEEEVEREEDEDDENESETTIGDNEEGSMFDSGEEHGKNEIRSEKEVEKVKVASIKKKTSKGRREPVDAGTREANMKTVSQKLTRQFHSKRGANRSKQHRELQFADDVETADDETSADESIKIAESAKGGKKSRKRIELERTKSEPMTGRRNVELRTSKRKKHESGHRARAQLKLRRAANVERPLSKRIMAAKKRRIEEDVNEMTAKKRKIDDSSNDTSADEEVPAASDNKMEAVKTRRTIVNSSNPLPPVRVLRSKRKKAEIMSKTEDSSKSKNAEAADDRVSNARSKKSKTKDEAECAKADSSAMNVIDDGSKGDTTTAKKDSSKDEFRQPSKVPSKSSQKRQLRHVEDEAATVAKRRGSNDLGFSVTKTAGKTARRGSKSSTSVASEVAKEGDSKARRRSVAKITTTMQDLEKQVTLSGNTISTISPLQTSFSDVEQTQIPVLPENITLQEESNFLGVPPSIPPDSRMQSSVVKCVLNDESTSLSSSSSLMGEESMVTHNVIGTPYPDDNVEGQMNMGPTKPWYSQAIDFLGQRSFGSLGSIINSVNELLAHPEVISSYSLDDMDSCRQEALQYYMDQNQRDDNFVTLVADLENGSKDHNSSTLEDDNTPTLMDLDKQSKPGTDNDNNTKKPDTLSPTYSSTMASSLAELQKNEEQRRNGEVKTHKSTTNGLKQFKCNHCREVFSSKDDMAVHVQEHLRKFAMSKTDNALLLRKCITKKFEGLLVEKALTNYLKSPQKAVNRNNNSLKLLSMVNEAKKNQLSTWKNAISQMLEIETNTSSASEAVKAALTEPMAMKDRSRNFTANGDSMDNGEIYPCPMCSKTFEQTNQRNRHLIMVHARQTASKSKPQNKNENCSDEVSTTAKIIESYLMKNTIDSCPTKMDKQMIDQSTKRNGVVEAKSNGTTIEGETTTNYRRGAKPSTASSNMLTVKSKNVACSDNTHPAFTYFDVKSDKPAAATTATAATPTQDLTIATNSVSIGKEATTKKNIKKPCRKKMSRKEMDLPPDLVKQKAEQALRELTFGRFIRTS